MKAITSEGPTPIHQDFLVSGGSLNQNFTFIGKLKVNNHDKARTVRVCMAKAKTNSFYLRETIEVNTAAAQESMDLTIYVDPVNKQGLLIKQVDFIWTESDDWVPPAAAAWQAAIQVHDTALGGLVDPEDTHNVASGSIVSTTSGSFSDEDFFPDRLGMAKGEGRIIVNDTLEICTDGNGSIPASYVCTVVMEVQVVKLTEKDYITLALQTVSDNS